MPLLGAGAGLGFLFIGNSNPIRPLYIYDTAFKYFDIDYGAALAWVLFLVVAVFCVDRL